MHSERVKIIDSQTVSLENSAFPFSYMPITLILILGMLIRLQAVPSFRASSTHVCDRSNLTSFPEGGVVE